MFHAAASFCESTKQHSTNTALALVCFNTYRAVDSFTPRFVTAAVSNKEYKSINNDPDAIEFSFDISTTPVKIDGYKPTATLVINSTVVDAKKLKEFEEILYGKDPELLKESPADWSTNWKNYVEKKAGEYVLIDSVTAPEFETGKYYAPGVESRLMLPDEVAAFFAEG